MQSWISLERRERQHLPATCDRRSISKVMLTRVRDLKRQTVEAIAISRRKYEGSAAVL
ncbi:MAG TPA: hypothetical protein V6D43_09910 [Candidatus Sericytochromatia bacterium]